MTPRRLTEIARFTKQPHAIAEFYAAALDAPGPASGDDEYHFAVDGVSLLIHAADESAQPGLPQDVDRIAFAVDDLDAECERLRAKGYKVTGPTELPWGRSAYLYDPDGRMVELQAANQTT